MNVKNLNKLNNYDLNSIYFNLNTEDEILNFKKIEQDHKKLIEESI